MNEILRKEARASQVQIYYAPC